MAMERGSRPPSVVAVDQGGIDPYLAIGRSRGESLDVGEIFGAKSISNLKYDFVQDFRNNFDDKGNSKLGQLLKAQRPVLILVSRWLLSQMQALLRALLVEVLDVRNRPCVTSGRKKRIIHIDACCADEEKCSKLVCKGWGRQGGRTNMRDVVSRIQRCAGKLSMWNQAQRRAL
ncbi:hypothetical protein QYF36_006336 [Acer negundo]|nr:hypothetical protein QYF36_006336 [Acer negundo]